MLLTLLHLGEILGISSLLIFKTYFLGVLYSDFIFLMQKTRIDELIYIPIYKKENYSICNLYINIIGIRVGTLVPTNQNLVKIKELKRQ